MPVHAIENNYGPNKVLVNQTLLADTSFVFAYHDSSNDFHETAKKFKDSNADTTFVLTVTVKQEILHEIRKKRLASVFSRHRDVKRASKHGFRDIAKILIKKGLKAMVQSKLRGHLESELQRYENGFNYLSGTVKVGNLVWTDAIRLMEDECLDSSDAMILNFAAKKSLFGIISCDRDFDPYYNPPNLNIYMPKRLIDWKNSAINLSA